MNNKRKNYIITNHMRERFVERTNKKFNHLKKCSTSNCDICYTLIQKIQFEMNFHLSKIDEEIYRRLQLAEENRSYINNTNYMSWYQEKYGYDKGFEFLVHEDIVFVVVVEGSEKVIVTCVNSQSHIAGRSPRKFKKKKQTL